MASRASTGKSSSSHAAATRPCCDQSPLTASKSRSWQSPLTSHSARSTPPASASPRINLPTSTEWAARGVAPRCVSISRRASPIDSISSVEAEEHDVAVLDDVVLALVAGLAVFLGCDFAAEGDVVVVGDGLGTDETAFKIGVEHSGSLRGPGALADGPGARLFRAGGEICLQAKQLVGFADQSIQAGLMQAEGLEVLGLLGVRQLRELALDLGGDDDDGGVVLPSVGLDLFGHGVAGGGRRLVDVADVERRFRREKLQLAEGLLFVGRALDETRRLAVAEEGERAVDEIQRELALLVAALGFLLDAGAALLEAFEVGEHERGLDHLSVGDRINLVGDVDDVGILEAAQHVGDGVAFADVGEELVTEAFALACALHEAGDVDETHAGRDDLLALGDHSELVEARVGHRHLAGVRLDGAAREIGRLGVGG